ncbi:MAG: histidine kinase dimerization/phospho-acceptor domain-containing protein [Acidobacteriota bacterium]
MIWTARRRQAQLEQELSRVREEVQSISRTLSNAVYPPDQPHATQELEQVKHDLRTPLTSILGFCALLQRTAQGLSPKQERLLGGIDAGARQMLEMVGSAAGKPRH